MTALVALGLGVTALVALGLGVTTFLAGLGVTSVRAGLGLGVTRFSARWARGVQVGPTTVDAARSPPG